MATGLKMYFYMNLIEAERLKTDKLIIIKLEYELKMCRYC